MVYVISQNGKPLMPTNNNGKVRILLKSKKAKIIDYKPFTIQLLYKTTEYVEPTILGMDTGRKHIAITVVKKDNGEVLFSSELTTRNNDIPKLMKTRKQNRTLRRHFHRQRKVRIAKKNNTYYKNARNVTESGTKLSVTVKYIKKKKAKFSNRKRPAGWLTPTANQLLETHINYINKVRKIVPISEVVVEYAKFDMQKLKDPTISGEEYQEGDLYGYLNMKAFISNRQKGKCLLCGKNHIEQLHHVKERHEEGSERHSNIAGLCKKCHDKVHKFPKYNNKLKALMEGADKQFNSTSILNTIMPYLYKGIQGIFGEDNVFKTYGYITKADRINLGLDKTHYNDSYIIALSRVNNITTVNNIIPYKYMQFRRHNRQLVDAIRDRYYKDGIVTIARNRNKRTDQLEPSLKEYKEELLPLYPKKEVYQRISNLKVVPSIKRYKTSIKNISVPYGSVVLYNGERHIVKGTFNKGKNLRLVDKPSENINFKNVRLLQRNTGIVCI